MKDTNPGKILKITPLALAILAGSQTLGSSAFFFIVFLGALCLLEVIVSGRNREIWFGSALFFSTAIALPGMVKTAGLVLALAWPLIAKMIQAETEKWSASLIRRESTTVVFLLCCVGGAGLFLKTQNFDLKSALVLVFVLFAIGAWPLLQSDTKTRDEEEHDLLIRCSAAMILFLLLRHQLSPWTWIGLVLFSATGTKDSKGLVAFTLIWMLATLVDGAWVSFGGLFLIAGWTGGMALVGGHLLAIFLVLMLNLPSVEPEVVGTLATVAFLISRHIAWSEFIVRDKKREAAGLFFFTLGLAAVIYHEPTIIPRLSEVTPNNLVLALSYCCGLVVFNLASKRWANLRRYLPGLPVIPQMTRLLSYIGVTPGPRRPESFSGELVWGHGREAAERSDLTILVWATASVLLVWGLYWLCG